MLNVSFRGKDEVIYGLTQAAKAIKNAEKQKLTLNNPHYHTSNIIPENIASARAYLDMATKDKLFLNTISGLNNKESKTLSAVLASEKTEHGEIKPIEKFLELLMEISTKNQGQNSIAKIFNFINSIKI